MRQRNNQSFSQRDEDQSYHNQRAPKRTLNPEDRPFRCPEKNCDKSYPQFNGIYPHLKAKHKNNVKQILIKYKLIYGKHQQKKEQSLRHQGIAAGKVQLEHMSNTKNTYNRIRDEWPKNPRIHKFSQVLFNIAHPSLEDIDVDNDIDLVEIRKGLVTREVKKLVQEIYKLGDMDFISKSRHMEEFQGKSVPGSPILNFAYDLVINFKPSFAARLWLIIFSLCPSNDDLKKNEQWKRFLEKEWTQYAFIDEILNEYWQKWKIIRHELMNFS